MTWINNYKPRGGATNPDPSATELANTRRQLAEAQAALEASKSQAQKDADAIRTANATRDATVLSTFLDRVSAKHKALNPHQVSALLGGAFEVIDGKSVKVKGSPDVDPEAHAATWFQGEGKLFVAPAVAPGAGAPNNAGTVPQAPEINMRSSEGKTQFVRSLRLVPPPPPAAPGATPETK